MRVDYIGNFSTPHSTESHVAQALEALDVEVIRRQENNVAWCSLPVDGADADFVLWTTTADLAPPPSYPAQREFLLHAKAPVVGFHLDRWWGLNREHRVWEAPFFRADLVVTADGGHDEHWRIAGVNHRWMPPAVSEFECASGEAREEYRSALAFVGSWQGGYHREWRHRDQLVQFLQQHYPNECAFWPKPGQHAIRGADLRDLYASVPIIVGDSCLAGHAHHYWSDRIPECVGRGGFLLHPFVEGLSEHFTPGEHLATWRLGDWDELRQQITYYFAFPEEARRIAEQGRAHVLERHTYTRRMEALIDLLRAEELL